ncbi:hypothetical protein WICMUC_002711 [Wickerhamomyces mucosus]|uniref:triacylglycerol lipase n=1 Tax=Wickerhamomyces mucosus TaxID=1378264 RepID=A0A9P8PNL0_9ASCO|nr:hypothetical protein WICMUC_002711 [Wickerhamomyces mucosus]
MLLIKSLQLLLAAWPLLNASIISDSVYDTLNSTAIWSKISYCTVFNKGFTAGKLQTNCPNMEFCNTDHSESIEILEVFRPKISKFQISGTGFVAADHLKKQIFIVFRGSMSAGDWFTDFIFDQCPYYPIIGGPLKADFIKNSGDIGSIKAALKAAGGIPICDDCFVHCGLYVELLHFLPQMYNNAKRYIDKGYQLVVTGHSLGGGYSAIAGLDLLLSGESPLTISYAPLKIGNTGLNRFIDSLYDTSGAAKVVEKGGSLPIPSFSNVYQASDPVYRLPVGFNYTHSGLEFEINKIQLPHNKDDVNFKGMANHFDNSEFDFDLKNPLLYFIIYQHIYQFIRISYPCNDLELPFVTTRVLGDDRIF